LRVLLAGTMIFKFAVRKCYVPTYLLLLIVKYLFLFLNSLNKNITKIEALKARTMSFEISLKKSSRHM